MPQTSVPLAEPEAPIASPETAAAPTAAPQALGLDPDQVAAFQAGKLGLPAGARVHVTIGGKSGTVPSESLQSTLARPDARVLTPKEVHDADIQRQFGDGVGMLEAGGAGLARGLTAGLSDPLIIGTAGAIGGHHAAEEARKTLAGVQEANPITSGVTEGVGAVAPLLVGDPAGIIGEGARGVGAVARGAEGAQSALRGAGTITRGINTLGGLAERGAGALMGEGSTSFLGRLAQSAVREGANAGVQTALYNAGSQISEDVLGDTETNGEKLWQALGHGFLLGAAGGGLLASTGVLGREVLGRAAPKLTGTAEEQAWRTISGRKAFQTAAEKVPGGDRAIGRVLLDDGLIAMGDRLEDVAPKVAAAREAAGGRIGELLDVADKAAIEGPKVADIQRRVVEDVLPDLKKLGNTNSGAVAKVEGLLEDLTNFARSSNKLSAEADAGGLKLTFRQTQDFRRRLDDLIKWETNPMAPINATTTAMKGVRGAIEDVLTEAGEKASKDLGGSWTEAYDAAKLKFRQLTVADNAAADAVERMQANRRVSPTDYMIGAAGLAGGLGHGVLSGGLHGLALSAAHHVVRERGNATAAVLLDKLAAMGGIQKAIAKVDLQIARGVENAVNPGARARPKLREVPFGTSPGSHEERVGAVMHAATNADAHAAKMEEAIAAIAPHAPLVANAFQQSALRATALLAGKVPGSKGPPSITPQFDRSRLSDTARAEFDRASHLTHDPVGYTFHRIDRGTLTRSDVDALKTIAPKTYDEIVQKTRAELAGLRKPLPFDRKMQIETLLGAKDEGALVGQILEQSVAPPTPIGGQPGAGTGAPKRAIKGISEATMLK
jgi:hypothetical protein